MPIPVLLYFAIASFFLENRSQVEVQQIGLLSEIEFDLQFVTKTSRISSGLFCEVEMDKDGNAYIASFKKTEDGFDRPYLVKLGINGKKIWERIFDVEGRATALTIDKRDKLFISGIYQGRFYENGHEIYSPENALFFGHFNSDGQCLELEASIQNALPIDIQYGGPESVLMAGFMGELFEFGDCKLINEESQDSYFLSSMDVYGECVHSEKIHGVVQRVKSDAKGNFIITGSFKNDLYALASDGIGSNKSMLYRGFVLVLDQDLGVVWVHPYKSKSFKESVVDISCLSNGNVAVLRQVDSLHTSRLYLDIFSNNGIPIASQLLRGDIQKRTVSTIVQHPNTNIWVSTKIVLGNELKLYKKTKEEREGKVILIELSESGSKLKEYPFSHGSNTLIRAAAQGNNGIIFSGHFQENIGIGNKKILGDGNHSIFLLRI